MEVKGVLYEDYVNYKKPSMLVMFPQCSFKCDKECGSPVCQNSALAQGATIEVPADNLIEAYITNPFTSAIVCGGLEPFDTFDDLIVFIKTARLKTNDDIIIYTGYTEKELQNQIEFLKQYKNIIVKFGRFVPDQERHYDETLGVYLASDNQYAERIS